MSAQSQPALQRLAVYFEATTSGAWNSRPDGSFRIFAAQRMGLHPDLQGNPGGGEKSSMLLAGMAWKAR